MQTKQDKNMIFYFSGTGNTRWVAEQIAEALNEELLYIPDLIRMERFEFQLKENENIGFCFPHMVATSEDNEIFYPAAVAEE